MTTTRTTEARIAAIQEDLAAGRISDGQAKHRTEIIRLTDGHAVEADLYSTNSGRVLCFWHLGSYGMSDVSHSPSAPHWITPLDYIVRMGMDERTCWAKFLTSEGYAEDADPDNPFTMCESCQEEDHRTSEAENK